MPNYRWSVRATNLIRIQFTKSVKRSASTGPIFPGRKAVAELSQRALMPDFRLTFGDGRSGVRERFVPLQWLQPILQFSGRLPKLT